MPFIPDTGFFVVARQYYSEVFPSFWVKMGEAVHKMSVYSVSQVKREIKNYGGKQKHLLKWVNQHENLFPLPSDHEQLCVKKIFGEPKFREAGEKKILMGGNWADPFVIAKAMDMSGTVVTREIPAKKDKAGMVQGAFKIPDVCQNFSIPCISPEEFMKKQQWVF